LQYRTRMLSGLLMFLTVQTIFGAELPFWKSKEKVYQRVKSGEIIVAVKTIQAKRPELPKYQMTVLGGGQVQAPASFVFQKALEFDDLARVSGFIKSAKFDPATEILELKVSALGFESEMKVLIKAKPESDPQQIDFFVTKGGMQGLNGKFTFTDLELKKSEIAVDCGFKADKFSAPRIFMEFGLEVVFQRMAARLRAHVEQEFKRKAAS
jgi:hypothetical protein